MAKRTVQPMKPFGDANDPSGFWLLLQTHLSWLKVHNYSSATVHKRGVYIRSFSLWCLGRDINRAADVTMPILEAFQQYLFMYRKKNGEPLAWSGQHLHLKEVRAFFAWLAKSRLIEFNPASEIELPKLPKSLPKTILSSAEVQLVLAQPDTTTPLGVRDRAILETFYSTGIRRAEMCGLKVQDIQVDRRSLFVNQGKGKKDRYVPVGKRALAWIIRYIDYARDQHLLSETEPTLFVTHHGDRIHPDSMTEYVRRYIRTAGIEKPGSCHIFRHTMATLMHENGADLAMLQIMLGHSKIDTTQIYAKTSLRRLLEVHDTTHPAEMTSPKPDEQKS